MRYDRSDLSRSTLIRGYNSRQQAPRKELGRGHSYSLPRRSQIQFGFRPGRPGGTTAPLYVLAAFVGHTEQEVARRSRRGEQEVPPLLLERTATVRARSPRQALTEGRRSAGPAAYLLAAFHVKGEAGEVVVADRLLHDHGASLVRIVRASDGWSALEGEQNYRPWDGSEEGFWRRDDAL